VTYVDNELLKLSKQSISVVEHAVEAKHFAIHLEKLSKFVEVRRCFSHLDSETLDASSCVWISWTVFWLVQYYTFAFQPILHACARAVSHTALSHHISVAPGKTNGNRSCRFTALSSKTNNHI